MAIGNPRRGVDAGLVDISQRKRGNACIGFCLLQAFPPITILIYPPISTFTTTAEEYSLLRPPMS